MDNNERDSLIKEIEYLKQILKDNNINYKDYKALGVDDNFSLDKVSSKQIINSREITSDDARLFYSYFKGRKDVYARRFISKKDGKPGYSWECNNLWQLRCPKSIDKSFKCKNCHNKSYKHLSINVLMEHLKGLRDDDRDIIGIYPLLKNNKCNLLVFDFDDHDLDSDNKDYSKTWMYELNALRCICELNNVPCLIERSRSGNGCHLWIFFEEEIDAGLARSFGDELLNRGMDLVNIKTFTYFDRMLPSQDSLPINKDNDEGLGNLIALPLQGKALKNGNSAFVDKNFNVYPDQFEVLKNTKKLSKNFVEEFVKDRDNNELKNNEENKPWNKKKWINKEDVVGEVLITIANRIYIDTSNIKPRGQNALRLKSCFNNSVYYKNKAMGYSNFKVERFIYAGYDENNYICLPRGLFDEIIDNLNKEDIEYVIKDLRQTGKTINVSFNGELYPEQVNAFDSIKDEFTGIIGATTSFGKTAVGSYLIAKRKVNTLILVHNKQILDVWLDGLKKFLTINEELPTYKTSTGIVKRRKEIVGRLYSGHNSLTGIVDVALYSSFGKGEDINPILEDYGMVIMDECHHGAAETVGEVLDKVKAKYVYGLTATPKRDDGKEKLVYMHFGPIRFRYTAKDRLAKQNMPHLIYPRFTRLTGVGNISINEAYNKIIESEDRNKLIVSDVLNCIKDGRTPLILTKQIKHAEILFEMLKDEVDEVFLLRGGLGKKEKEIQKFELDNVKQEETLVIIAIDVYASEGFNYPRLDTLMYAMPVKFEGKVEQSVGRLHRDYKDKSDVIVYDYVDIHIPMLERMYLARLKTYKKIGYELVNNDSDELNVNNNFFDSNTYLDAFNKDVLNSNKEVIISSTSLSRNRIYSFINLIKQKQYEGGKFKVLTLSLDKYKDEVKQVISESIIELERNGIEVIEQDNIYKKFAIIDDSIIYYGTINLLSKVKEDDTIIRIIDKGLGEELLTN